MTKTDEVKKELEKAKEAKKEGTEPVTFCEDCGQAIYEDDATIESQGLICHSICPAEPDRGAPFEKSEPMKCNKCFKVLPPEARLWELTVGQVEIGAPYFEEDYFEPSEHTEYRCGECMGEKE